MSRHSLMKQLAIRLSQHTLKVASAGKSLVMRGSLHFIPPNKFKTTGSQKKNPFSLSQNGFPRFSWNI